MRQRVSSGSSYEANIGFSRAVRVDRQVFVSATAAIWPDGRVDPDAGDQARRSLAIIEASLREAGASLEDVVRTRIFLVDAADGEAVGAVHGEVFGDVRPASAFKSWANGGRSSEWAPKRAQDFAALARAASRRYERVRLWMIWGEPSRDFNFKPLPGFEATGRAATRASSTPPTGASSASVAPTS